MAETSKMIPLGTIAPSFKLRDTLSGVDLQLSDLASDKATVIAFICNHCPYVKHIQSKFIEIAKIYQAKGVSFIAISSNDPVGYPQDGPDMMHNEAKQHGYTFPYLFDADQSVAKAYQAVCTPEMYIFDGELRCAYRGRFDESNPKNGLPCTGKDLTNALDDVLAGKAVSGEQVPSIGCGIKWK